MKAIPGKGDMPATSDAPGMTATRGRTFAAMAPFAVLLLVILAFLYANPLFDGDVTGQAPVVRGAVDLSANSGGINRLAGEWAFRWNEFAIGNPAFAGESSGAAAPPEGPFVSLPGGWTSLDGTRPFGYASYILRVSGLDPDLDYALEVGQVLSACRVLVNGRVVESIGTPGSSPSGEEPAWDTVLAGVSPLPDGTAEIILQVSNFRDVCGGSNAPFFLGEASVMRRMLDAQKLTEGFVFAVLVILGCFFFFLFLFRRKDVPFLWFSLLCGVVGFRALCYEGFVLLDIIPSIPWPLFFRLGYLTFPLIMVFFIVFLGTILPSLVGRIPVGIVSAVFGVYALIVAFAPVHAVAILLRPFQILGIATVLFGVQAIVRAFIAGLDGARWLFVGFSFAVAAFVNDILISLWIFSGISLGHVGMAICLFCMALMVIERYSLSFSRERDLSLQLQVINRSLKRFVPAEFLACLNKGSITDVNPGDCVEVEMSILSADIRSFTSIAEKMSPKDVFVFLNEYLELVGPIIRSNGGFIAKYEGDGFYALFPKGPEAALQCAVQMQSAVGARNRNEPGQKPLAVGIGIDTGKLVLGTIGDDFRIDSAIISSCVKCAGRFEATTKIFGSKILINEAVFAGLSDPLAWFMRPVDRLEMDGRTSFLFEVYNNDTESLRDLKWRTQGDLEHAVYAWFAGQYEEARVFIARVLAVFPGDMVAQHYYRRLL